MVQIRAAAQQPVENEETKRRRVSYSSLPSSFILSLVHPVPPNSRGLYHVEAEVMIATARLGTDHERDRGTDEQRIRRTERTDSVAVSCAFKQW
jgi:hypothetical protein